MSDNKNGFLLIELLIALSIFVVAVQATLSLQCTLVAMQQSILNRLAALTYCSAGIEMKKSGLTPDNLLQPKSENQKFVFNKHQKPITISLVSPEKKLIIKSKKRLIPYTCYSIEWREMNNKVHKFELGG